MIEDFKSLHESLENADDLLQLSIHNKKSIFHGMIGSSPIMQKMFSLLKITAEDYSTVLIIGDPGTGKQLAAESIHHLSYRKNYHFISLDCSNIPLELLESELHEQFKKAQKGTLFLNKITEMSSRAQVKLFEIFSTKKIQEMKEEFDVRMIIASKKKSKIISDQKKETKDLFDLFQGTSLYLPSLSERQDDLLMLISYFLKKYSKKDLDYSLVFDKEIIEIFFQYQWPNNIKELETVIKRLLILKKKERITVEDLPQKLLEGTQYFQNKRSELILLRDEGIDLKKFLSDIENSLILQALKKTNGNKNQASKLLNINRTTLIEKIKHKRLC